MNKQQLMVFMNWVESSIDLKIAESFDRTQEHDYIQEINLRDKLLGLFQEKSMNPWLIDYAAAIRELK